MVIAVWVDEEYDEVECCYERCALKRYLEGRAGEKKDIGCGSPVNDPVSIVSMMIRRRRFFVSLYDDLA